MPTPIRINARITHENDPQLFQYLEQVPGGYRSERARRLMYIGLLVEQGKLPGMSVSPASNENLALPQLDDASPAALEIDFGEFGGMGTLGG